MYKLEWPLTDRALGVLRTALFTYIQANEACLGDPGIMASVIQGTEDAPRLIKEQMQIAISLINALPQVDDICQRCRMVCSKCEADFCPANVNVAVDDFLKHTIMRKPFDPLSR